MSLGAQGEGRADPELHVYDRLELTGTMNEPVRETRDVEIFVYSTDEPSAGKDPIPWVGLVHGLKPKLRPTFFFSNEEFDRLWSLAAAGLLRHAHMVVTPPRYQHAYVVSVSFSSHPQE